MSIEETVARDLVAILFVTFTFGGMALWLIVGTIAENWRRVRVAERIVARLETESAPRLRPVINATGVVLHTNLGRAPLHEEAARAAYEAARGYLNLELDLSTGQRGSRQSAVRAGICTITGAESATA